MGRFHTSDMSKQVVRSCPKCKGELQIVLLDRQRKAPVSAINGRCVKCGYRLAWILIRGHRRTRYSARRFMNRVLLTALLTVSCIRTANAIAQTTNVHAMVSEVRDSADDRPIFCWKRNQAEVSRRRLG